MSIFILCLPIALDLITDTKSSQDRSKSLLHYVVETISQNLKSGTDDEDEQQQIIKSLSTISPTSAQKKFGTGGGVFSGADQITLENTKLPFDLDKLVSLLGTLRSANAINVVLVH